MMTIDGRAGVLDHGYVSLVRTWGTEEEIIEAARMSTGKGFLGWGRLKECAKCKLVFEFDQHVSGHPCVDGVQRHGEEQIHEWKEKKGDEHLLRHLYTNKHMTPFEMAGATFEVMAPIFVFREWHRHRTQSYNEQSARYEPLPDVNYIPALATMLGADAKNKQAGTVKDAGVFGEEDYPEFVADTQGLDQLIQSYYDKWLKRGVRKEQARIRLPVGRYSRMRASTDLRNWMAFLTLRHDKAAQWEIQQYARVIHSTLSSVFPRTMALFDEGRRGNTT